MDGPVLNPLALANSFTPNDSAVAAVELGCIDGQKYEYRNEQKHETAQRHVFFLPSHQTEELRRGGIYLRSLIQLWRTSPAIPPAKNIKQSANENNHASRLESPSSDKKAPAGPSFCFELPGLKKKSPEAEANAFGAQRERHTGGRGVLKWRSLVRH